MVMKSYETEVESLCLLIDLAMDAIRKYPPKNYRQEHISNFESFYQSEKKKLLNPEPKYRTMASLSISKSDILTFFQETSGEGVDYFWRECKKRHLPAKRENRLKKVLKRKKIKTRAEYDFIVDVLTPYQQEGLINSEDLDLINRLIREYESNNS